MRLLIVIFILISLPCFANDKGAHIAGIVKDTHGNLISAATVVITRNHEKLVSLRTNEFGWFESSYISPSQIADSAFDITVLKKGYEPTHIQTHETFLEVEIQNLFSRNNYAMEPVQKVTHGQLLSERNKRPIEGAILVLKNKEDIALSSAISRESGFFNLYYKDSDLANDYYVEIKHPDYDTKPLDSLNRDVSLRRIEMTQNRYHFSLGVSGQIQTTGDSADSESGGAVALNVSWYPDALIVVNKFMPRPRKKHTWAADFSVGAINYVEPAEGEDEVEYTPFVGLGASRLSKSDLFTLRVGVFRTNTHKNGIYLGVGMPMVYFGLH